MMNTDTTPVRIDTAHGPLYVAVTAAKRDSFHDSERGNVTKLRPQLRAATDPTFEADPAHAEHWTIRGRAYAVHYEIFFEDRTKIQYANDYQGERWHQGHYTPYLGGFRNDKRRKVEFGTATWDAMWKATTTALDTFDTAHPGWMDLSRFLLLNGESASATRKAEEAEQEAAAQHAKAGELRTRASEFMAGMPADTMALYTEKNQES